MTNDIEWRVSPSPVTYLDAVRAMEERVDLIERGEASELIWMLEHPPMYTAGTSASDDELIDPSGLPVFQTGRGGRFTYHGPGQRVIYVLSDLRPRGRDIRAHISRLEQWIIDTLAALNIAAERRTGRIGIWVDYDGREEKIAAIGVRVRRWVSYHGLALNIAPNLDHFKGIVPCGLGEYGVTSLAALGKKISMQEVDDIFRQTYSKSF